MEPRFDQVCLYVKDPRASAAVYAAAFGFAIDKDEWDGVYVTMHTGAGRSMLGLAARSFAVNTIGVGEDGLRFPKQGGTLGSVEIHVRVPDVDAAVARAEKAGFKLVTPAFDLPWGSRFAYLQDPEGNLFNAAGPVKAGAATA